MAKKEDVVFKVSADQAKAVQEFLKLINAQEGIERGAEKVDRSMKRQKQSVDKSAISFGKLTGSMIGMSSGLDVLRQASQVAGSFAADMEMIAEKSNAAAKARRSFVSIFADTDKAREQQQELLNIARDYGIKEPDAVGYIETIVSSLNKGDIDITDQEMAKIKTAVTGASKVIKVGVPESQAGNIEAIGAGMGLDAGEATAKTLEAGAVAKDNKAEFPKIISYLTGFKDLDEALAIAGPLSGVTGTVSDAGEKSKQLSRLLGATGVNREFIKERGLAGKSAIEIVDALTDEAITEGKQDLDVKDRIGEYVGRVFGDTKKTGLKETEIEALAKVLPLREDIKNLYGKLKETGPESIDEQYQKIKNDDGQDVALATEEAQALTFHNLTKGPLGELARKWQAERVAGGLSMQALGLPPLDGYLYNSETSAEALTPFFAKKIAKGTERGLPFLNPFTAPVGVMRGMMFPKEEEKSPISILESAINNLREATKEQTDIVKQQLEETKKANEKRDDPIYNTEGNN